MTLSIIIPCYNEVTTISEIVRQVHAIDIKDLEIIVVDDASNDGTREVLEKIVKPLAAKIIYHSKNMGKGTALRSGFEEAKGDVVVVQDADLEYNPQNIPKMLKLIESGMADVVFGSRFMGGGPHRVLYFWHYIGNKCLTLFSNMFTNLNLTDMETCYKLFKTSTIQKLELKEKLPEMSAAEQYELLASDGMLIKRPLAWDGSKVTLGFKEETYTNTWG